MNTHAGIRLLMMLRFDVWGVKDSKCHKPWTRPPDHCSRLQVRGCRVWPGGTPERSPLAPCLRTGSALTTPGRWTRTASVGEGGRWTTRGHSTENTAASWEREERPKRKRANAALTSVWTIWQRWALILVTKPNTSTFLSAIIMSNMASITMKVPVLPTPALIDTNGTRVSDTTKIKKKNQSRHFDPLTYNGPQWARHTVGCRSWLSWGTSAYQWGWMAPQSLASWWSGTGWRVSEASSRTRLPPETRSKTRLGVFIGRVPPPPLWKWEDQSCITKKGFMVPVGCRTCGWCSPPGPLCLLQTHECFRMSNSPGPASTGHTYTEKQRVV